MNPKIFQPMTLRYRNYRGEIRTRTVQPLGLRFAATEWHPKPQWLLDVLDMEKEEPRNFALKDCNFALEEVAEIQRLTEENRALADTAHGYDLAERAGHLEQIEALKEREAVLLKALRQIKEGSYEPYACGKAAEAIALYESSQAKEAGQAPKP